MQSKIVSRRALLVAVLTGLIALSPVLLVYFIPKSFNLPAGRQVLIGLASLAEKVVAPPNQEQAVLIQEQTSSGLPALPIGKPMRLKIPKININATVEHVGLASDGAMDTPTNQNDVGWFELGQRPGASGSAVIAGHYGWKNRKGSVFDNLHKLRKGDKISVEDDKGVITFFVVRESRRYDPKADSSGVFGSNDGKAHLNLVTCEGEWDEVAQSYSKRLVVFTDKE